MLKSYDILSRKYKQSDKFLPTYNQNVSTHDQ